MIITCPSCKAQAQIPDNKEGAKVRCGECDRVYKALSGGRRAATSKDKDLTLYFIPGGAALVLLLLFLVVRGSGKEKVIEVEEPKKVFVKKETPKGWKAPAVQEAVKLHKMAFEQNRLLLRAQLHGGLLLEKNPLKEGQTVADFKVLTSTQQTEVLDAAVADIMDGGLVVEWDPFDGHVVPPESWATNMPEDTVVVRLDVAPRDKEAGLDNRHVEWHFIKTGVAFKAYGWQPWVDPEEKKKVAKTRKFTQTTLSDGSQVVEGVIRDIPYMEETPQELQDQVEALIDELIDPESRPFKVRKALEEIGKPAIPGLLTRMANIPFEPGENAIALNLIHLTLGDITGHIATFRVSELMGATKERQESGLKQWFGWYDRKFKRFTKRVDPVDEEK